MRHVAPLLSSLLFGCSMAPMGTHSLSSSPLVTPWNDPANGFRPPPRLLNANYFGGGGRPSPAPRPSPRPKETCCRGTVDCEYFSPSQGRLATFEASAPGECKAEELDAKESAIFAAHAACRAARKDGRPLPGAATTECWGRP